MERTYSIQFVSKITGINSHTIRAWEKRYQAVVPARTDKGKRIYSQDDVDRLQKLSDLVQIGNSISDVASLGEDELEKMHEEFVGKIDPITRQEEKNYASLEEIQLALQNLIMALKAYKLDIIAHELEKIKNSVSGRDFALGIIGPLLAEVGAQVEGGALNIAQEHSLSAILKFQIGNMLYGQNKNRQSAKVIVLASPEGELHEFGIMIAGILCAHYGHKFYYFGANLPAESFAEASNNVEATTLVLGVSKSFHESNSRRLEEYLGKLCETMSPKTQIFVGGDYGNKVQGFGTQEISYFPTLSSLDQALQTLK